MQTTVETLGALERRFNVAIPVQEIESEVEKRLTKMARSARLPGFRPGKVPMKLIVQQYGPQMRSEVITDRVQAQFNDVVRDQNLRVAGYPRIEPRAPAAGNDALEFQATFEVYPEIKLNDLASMTIEKPDASVTEADIDATLQKLQLQRATWKPVTRAAQKGDRARVDFTGAIDGVEFPGGQATDFPIGIGEGRMLPEFEAAVAGMQPGETKTFPLVFPADYHGKDVAGKSASFTLTMKALEEPELPPLDDAFAKAFGVASGKLADLRAEVDQNLKLELKRKLEALTREQALRALRAAANFAVPGALVEMEANNMLQRAAQNLIQQGVKREDIRLTPDAFREQAAERVTLGLALSNLIEKEGLAATPDQVRARVAEAASTYEQPDAVVRWHYEQPERLAEFEAAASEQNVVDWVLGKAKVVPTPRTFDELMNPGPGSN
ncbi:MAG: trigger factor [Proteobacteria bacterium]|nr:trigger factor [Pseudomonadota bacterium]